LLRAGLSGRKSGSINSHRASGRIGFAKTNLLRNPTTPSNTHLRQPLCMKQQTICQ
jgi:hypothetical protein